MRTAQLSAPTRSTTLQSFAATIRGKEVWVEQLHGGRNRQDIYYKVNGKEMTSDEFWDKKPKVSEKTVTKN